MKKQILQLGRKHKLNLTVDVTRYAFDILGYEIWAPDGFICADTYYTGTTNTRISYPFSKSKFLKGIEKAIKEHKKK